MKLKAAALSLLLVVSLVGMAAAPAASQSAEGEAYSGANVQFETTGNAVTNYTVGGDVLVDNVTVQSSSEAESGLGADAGLEAMTGFSAAGLELTSTTRASATINVESGAEMESHDNEKGVLQIHANGDDQMVHANLSSDAEAHSESDQRVIVEKDDGTQGAFIVVGDGEVVVNDEGNVTAEIEGEGELVYRQYDSDRSDDDEDRERMIEEGTATAEVFVQESAEDGEETAADAVEYGQDTSVEVVAESQNTVEMNVERAESDGKVVLMSVSEAAFENADDLEVFVDGEAAAQADSYSEVEQSAMDGDEPRFHVVQSSSAEATTDVAVGIDHFSERNMEMTTDGNGDTDDGADDTDADGTGFGVLAALVALGAALIAVRHRA